MLETDLAAFYRHHRQHIGMVSVDVPLISNLDVWINIALIKQYHENLSSEAAQQEVLGYLRRFKLERIAQKRNPALNAEQRFVVMLLRAVMVGQALVVIDRPFRLMPALKDSRFIYDSLLLIADLYDKSFIFDYLWHKELYRIDHAS